MNGCSNSGPMSPCAFCPTCRKCWPRFRRVRRWQWKMWRNGDRYDHPLHMGSHRCRGTARCKGVYVDSKYLVISGVQTPVIVGTLGHPLQQQGAPGQDAAESRVGRPGNRPDPQAASFHISIGFSVWFPRFRDPYAQDPEASLISSITKANRPARPVQFCCWKPLFWN